VYPALFVEYLRFWMPDMTPVERWLLVVAFIAVLTGLNLLGIRPTGHAAVALAIVSLLPVAALTVAALLGPRVSPWTPLAPAGLDWQTVGLGLAVVMWNYSGWDTPSTILGEARSPERAFRAATFLALPVVTAAYLLPLGAALASGAVPWSQWTTGVLPTIARSIGGDWLGHAVAAGAVLSTGGLFTSLLLTNSRLPYVMARDHVMPRWLGVVDPTFGTPWTAVVVSAALYAAFAVFSFKELIVLNVWLYSLSLLVELAAFVRLRLVAPEMDRPWRVPGGLAVAVGVVACPTLFCLGAMATAGFANTLAGVVAALTGPLVYRVLGRRTMLAGEERA
jgi:amino acid transporter